MKKQFTILFICFNLFIISAQKELSVTIDKATYKAKEAFLSLELTFKNNTDQPLYVLKPKSSFFVNHYDTENKLQYHGLNVAPYSLDIVSNKRCKVSDEGYIQIDLDGYQIRLLDQLVKLESLGSKTFKNIDIERYDGVFCKNRSFSIQLTYQPNFYIMDDKTINKMKGKYELIKKETDQLNGILSYTASDYRSIENDNFKKLKSLFENLKKMKALNSKIFTSNKITATELK